MCLLTLNREPEVAKGDIICYKVLRRSREDGHYYTPYQEKKVLIHGHICSASKERLQECEIGLFTSVTRWMVKGEGVHAYTKMEKAIMYTIDVCYLDPSVIVQCRIPAGTEYWLGENDEIAARVLYLEKII